MNKKQSAVLAMGHSTLTAVGMITATSVPPVYAAKEAALKTKIEAINAAAAAQGAPTVGKTEDRDRVYNDLLTATRLVAAKVRSYAGANELGDLGANVRVVPSRLQQARATTKVRVAQQVHNAAQGVLASLSDYGVTAATLTDLQTKIDAAEAQVSASRDAIVARKVATGQLAGALAGFHAFLRKELDPLVESLRESHPTEHAAYRAARITINPTRSATTTTPPPPEPASAPVV